MVESVPVRSRRRARVATAFLVLCIALASLVATQTASAEPPPPPFANDFTCKPTAAHPYPVVLVHGTFGQQTDWSVLSPVLKASGYCLFSLNYGGSTPDNPIQGTGRIEDSAGQLATFIDRVRSASGASKVDIIGHSQGGMMPRYYLKFRGGATRVHRLIGLAPSNHGTTASGILTLAQAIPGATQFLGALCPACTEQTAGSQFLQNLNAGGDTVAGVLYTVIETRYDEVVTPYTSAFLSGSAVTNIRLQDRCFLDFVGHIAIITDANVFQYVKNALDPAHAAPVFCFPFPPSL